MAPIHEESEKDPWEGLSRAWGETEAGRIRGKTTLPLKKTKIFFSSVESKFRSNGIGMPGCGSFGILLILPHIPVSPDQFAPNPNAKTL